MDIDQVVFCLTRHGIWGTNPIQEWNSMQDKISENEWKQISRRAKELQLDPFAGFALKKGQGLNCPSELYFSWMEEIYHDAFGRIVATQVLQKWQGELYAQGIESAVLKGLALASAYKYPEQRSGCDVDLYVDKCHEKKLYQMIKSQGWKVEKRIPGTHHGELMHPILGHVELHVQLCNGDELLVESQKSSPAILVYPQNAFVSVENKGQILWTLDHTEHMLFIISHLINHYLHGEEEVRQILDCNAYFYKYQTQIRQKELQNRLEELSYQRFFFMVLLIGNLYFGFQHELQKITGVQPTDNDRNDAKALLRDFCIHLENRQEAVTLYDLYCNQQLSGINAFALKVRLLARNVTTAWQLRNKLSLGEMYTIGKKRMKNLIWTKDLQFPKERWELLQNLGIRK